MGVAMTIRTIAAVKDRKWWAWAALACVAAVMVVGCAAQADDTAASDAPVEDGGRRAAFVARADQACRDFDTGLHSIAAATAGARSLEELSPEELAAFRDGVLPLALTYYGRTTVLEAPSNGNDLAAQLTADAYETLLLLSALEDGRNTRSPDELFVSTPADVQAHLTTFPGDETTFREYGFTSCGKREL